MSNYSTNMDRRKFLKLSLLAVSTPAMLTGCGTPELKKLAKANPGVTPAQMRLVEFFSLKSLCHPEPTKKLLDFIVCAFSPEEAEVAQYLYQFPWHYMEIMALGSKLAFENEFSFEARSARSIAKTMNKPEKEVEAVLRRLTANRLIIDLDRGEGKPREYSLMLILPGMFELVMVEGKDDAWHRKYAQLFETVYDTGYFAKAIKGHSLPLVRYLPIEETVSSNPVVIPSDKLSEIIKNSKSIGLGTCQCKHSMYLAGKPCNAPRDVCLAFDDFADYLISRNIIRKIDKVEALEAKARATEAGLVHFVANMQRPIASCSCCSCCCKVLRTITQFDTPGYIAPPHFRPVRDEVKCVQCGICVDKCPMKAHVLSDSKWTYRKERCIGCGICANSCPYKNITMEAVKNYDPPPADWLGLAPRIVPKYIKRAILG